MATQEELNQLSAQADALTEHATDLANDTAALALAIGALTPDDGGSEPPVPEPPTTTDATPVAGSDANLNGQKYFLTALDAERKANELIAYTKGGVTSTNQYGVEATVVGGKITSIIDRVGNSITAGTPIPSGGYVLSGHDKAGDWLRTNAQSGRAVTYSKATSTPPTPVDPPSGGTQTGMQELEWHHGWSGPKLSAWPSDIKSETDLVVWGIGQSAGKGTGRITGPPLGKYGSAAEAKADVDAFKAAGKKVMYGIGGSSDGGITITNGTQVDEAFNSIVSICGQYGFNGLNFDLEPSGSSWNQASIVSLSQKLKAWSPGFYIDVCVGLYGSYTASWISLAKALGNLMDSMSVMLYDFPEAGDSRLTGVSVNKVDVLVGGGVPANKIILLYFMRPDAGYGNSTPTPSLVVNALKTVTAKYPTLKGFGWWEDQVNTARGWDGPRAVQSAF